LIVRNTSPGRSFCFSFFLPSSLGVETLFRFEEAEEKGKEKEKKKKTKYATT